MAWENCPPPPHALQRLPSACQILTRLTRKLNAQVGEFQCYDRRALASLAAAAQEAGHPEWGYTGPHDSGTYNSTPEVCPAQAAPACSQTHPLANRQESSARAA